MNNLKAKAGSMGGNVTLERYGVEYFADLGKRGGRPRALSLSEIRQQQASQQIKEGGIQEGELAGKTSNNLTMLKKEWLQQAGRVCMSINKGGSIELPPGS